ncbi:hypothetical protein R3I93_016733 [Phoxinus phoxinus]|uniref:Uncharacterized protein n=1 Tax=Phoxinus phoxinus TaxID=58324 RepID=A0AAN9CIM4_9TELE
MMRRRDSVLNLTKITPCIYVSCLPSCLPHHSGSDVYRREILRSSLRSEVVVCLSPGRTITNIVTSLGEGICSPSEKSRNKMEASS